jgi:hypothetical protein
MSQPEERFWTVGRALATLVLVVMAGAWVWGFSPLAPRGHPDRMEDRTFPEAAQTVCGAVRDQLDLLPRAFEAQDPAERGTFIDEASEFLRTMVDDLEDIAPAVVTGDSDTENVQKWLADWRTYIGDRDTYADVLRTGDDPAFTVTAIDGAQVTERIDGFADANDMENCQVPLDV